MDIAVAWRRRWVERMRVVRRSFILRSGSGMNSRDRVEDRCRKGVLRIVVVVV